MRRALGGGEGGEEGGAEEGSGETVGGGGVVESEGEESVSEGEEEEGGGGAVEDGEGEGEVAGEDEERRAESTVAFNFSSNTFAVLKHPFNPLGNGLLVNLHSPVPSTSFSSPNSSSSPYFVGPMKRRSLRE